MERGDVFEDRYQLIKPLGEGGMGYVWMALDSDSGNLVALKFLREDAREYPDMLGRFRNEYKVQNSLNDPGVVGIYSINTSADDIEYVVMEYFDGIPINSAKESMEPRDRVQWTTQVLIKTARALAFIHKKDIIHRDIKPSNILVSENVPDADIGDHRVSTKLIDFGIALVEGERNRFTVPGGFVGTPDFAPLEQLESSNSACKASDVFALACVAYELYAGELPWNSLRNAPIDEYICQRRETRPKPLPEYVPHGIADIVNRALSSKPSHRPTAHDFATELDKELDFADNLTRKPPVKVEDPTIKVPPPQPPVCRFANTLTLSLFTGFSVGYVAALIWFVSRIEFSSVEFFNLDSDWYYVLLIALFVNLVFAARERAAASKRPTRLLDSCTAGVGACAAWLLTAFSISPSLDVWSHVLLVPVALAAARAPIGAAWNYLWLTIAVAAGWYGWIGVPPDGHSYVLPLVMTTIAVIGCTAMLLERVSGRFGPAIVRLIGPITTTIVIGVMVLALISYPDSHAARTRDLYPVDVAVKKRLVGLPEDDPLLFEPASRVASSADGRIAIADRIGMGRYALWLMAPHGKWTRKILRSPLTRPDGQRMLLSTSIAPSDSEASLWQNLGKKIDPNEPFPALGFVNDISFYGDDVIAVSDSGVWNLSTDIPRRLAAPWDKSAVRRWLAVDADGNAGVVSNYRISGKLGSTFDVISLKDGKVVSPDIVISGNDYPVIKAGQWRYIGLSLLPDGSFSSQSGNAIVRFNALGVGSIIERVNFDSGDSRQTDYAITGRYLYAANDDGDSWLLEFTYLRHRLDWKSNERPTSSVELSTPKSGRYCGTKGTELTRISQHVNFVAEGPTVAAIIDGPNCTGGVWLRDFKSARWSLSNSVNTINSSTSGDHLRYTGFPFMPQNTDGKVQVISPTAASSIDVTGSTGRQTKYPTSAKLNVQNRPVAGFGTLSDGKGWLMVVPYGTLSSERGTSQLLVQPRGVEWYPSGWKAGGATAAITLAHSTVLVASCGSVFSVKTGDGWNQIVAGQADWSPDQEGCILDWPVPQARTADLGLVHSIGAELEDSGLVLVAHSLREQDNVWRHKVSQLDVETGTVSDIDALDLTDDDAIPVQVSAGPGSRICIATIDKNGEGPLFVYRQGVRRKLSFPNGIRPNGCAWWDDRLFVTDGTSGNTYEVVPPK